MSAQRIQLLQAMPVFGGVKDETLGFLLERARVTSRAAGEYFIREGEKVGAMFVLEIGTVEVLKQWEGGEYRLRILGTGDNFGEMAMIDLFPRSASVRAIEDCGAIEITHAILFDLYSRDLEQFTIIQMNIARELSRRLRAIEAFVFSHIPDVPWPQIDS